MFFIGKLKSIIGNINSFPDCRVDFPLYGLLLTSNTKDILNVVERKYTRSSVSRLSLKLNGVSSSVIHDDSKSEIIRQVMLGHLKPGIYTKIAENATQQLVYLLNNQLEGKDFIEFYLYKQLRKIFDKVMLEDYLGVVDFSRLLKSLETVKSAPKRKERLGLATFIAALPIPFLLKSWCLPTARRWCHYRLTIAKIIHDHSIQHGALEGSYLETLLQQEKDGLLNKKDVLGEINSAFDGSSSISTSITWSLLAMAANNQYQDAAKNKLMARHCYMEALRLYPPFHVLSYESLPSPASKTNGCPYSQAKSFIRNLLPSKSRSTIISVIGVQRSSAYWSNGDAFIPERWGNGHTDITKMAYIPFGIGKRACPARALSIVVGTTVLNSLFLNGFKFDLTADLPKPKRYYFLSDQDQTVKISIPTD